MANLILKAQARLQDLAFHSESASTLEPDANLQVVEADPFESPVALYVTKRKTTASLVPSIRMNMVGEVPAAMKRSEGMRE
eukprot:82229-Pyramimonas_sp.AAC.1